jgi:mRNA-degrading endonuclease RelE of RelBE toxin-antitoxin system
MTSHTTQSFRDRLARLPKNIRDQARAAYRRFKSDPHHKGLHFKKVHGSRPVYSARVNDDYRVVGILDANEIVWFWIGKHEEYERLLKQL